MSNSVEQQIRNRLARLNPQYLLLENESHQHSGPASDSHFKVTLVSDLFVNKRPVVRHQQVYQLLAAELEGSVHALALHLYTPDEWQQAGVAPQSPNCRSGH